MPAPGREAIDLPVAAGLEGADASFDSLAQLYSALRAAEHPRAGFSDRIVPGRGNEKAALFLLGEQPGDKEDQLGQTFVGPAGQELNRCLIASDIEPASTFQTNAVKRFKFLQRGARRLHQSPNAGDIEHYRWWVGQEIRLVDPAIIVPLGVTALQSLLGTRRPLKSLRGQIWRWNGRALLATVHPSYLLRLRPGENHEAEREQFISDLRMAAASL